MIENAYISNPEDLLKKAGTNFKTGLSSREAEERLRLYGTNTLDTGKKVSPFKILFHNANNIIVYLLILASGISFVMGETIEGFAVIIAILIAVLSGFISEYKAQKSVESLQKLTKTVAKVRRDSKTVEIQSEMLVPGDILFVEEGDLITADARGNAYALVTSTGMNTEIGKISGMISGEDESAATPA